MSAVVAVVAVLVVGVVARPGRPVPRRVRALLVGDRGAAAPEGEPLPARRRSAALGRRLVSVLAVLGAFALWPPLGLSLAGGCLLAPRLRARRARRQASRVVEVALPDVVDLTRLLVAAGHTSDQAVRALAGAAPAPFAAAFAEVARRVDRGERLAAALGALGERLGDRVGPLSASLAGAGVHGVALGPTLEQLAADARGERRRQADIRARQLPVRLAFPLVACILPAFALLTVAPLLAGALRSLAH